MLIDAGSAVARPFDEPLLRRRRLQALMLSVQGFVRNLVDSMARSGPVVPAGHRLASMPC